MIWIVLFGCLVVSVVGVAVVGNRPTPTSAFRSDEERNLYTQATLLARQEIAEIEWRAGLIEMPDHLKKKDKDVQRFVPFIVPPNPQGFLVDELAFGYWNDNDPPPTIEPKWIRKVDPSGYWQAS